MRYLHGYGVFVPFAQKYKKIIMLVVAAILVLSQATWLLGQVGATSEWPTTDPDKISICHASSAVVNPYEDTTVDLDAVDGSGNNDHSQHDDPAFNSSMVQGDDWGDIIPPNVHDADGLNWTTEGQAIWRNQCVVPEEEPLEPCTVAAVSDTTNKVVEYGNTDAVALSFTHSAWTADVPEATWIWSDNPVVDPTNETVRTFTKTFGWDGPVDTAIIKVAADNDYELWVNDVLIGTGSNTFATVNQHDIASAIQDGNNTIKVKVTNWAWPTSDPQVNPAGLKFQAVVTSTQEEGCNPPVEDEPEVPSVTLSASKVVCDDESDLPNDGFTSIAAATATDWLAAHPENGCELVQGWQFEYKTNGNTGDPGNEVVGPKGAPWTTFTGSVEVPIEDVPLIETREVLQEGYITFNGSGVSAEFYCGNDAANYDNWEWIQNPTDGATYYCVAWNVAEEPAPTTFTLHTTKIVCDTEAELPNWGGGNSGPITATTADTWLQAELLEDGIQNCQKAEWAFQWAPNTGNPGDQTEEATSPWSEPFSDSVVVDTNDLGESQTMWIREVFEEGFIPFGGQNTTNDVSAEIYCKDDVLNYDNWEFISNPIVGQDYYCVAWNVEAVGAIMGLIYHDVAGNHIMDGADEPLENWKGWLLTHNSPYTLKADYTTGADGIFVWHDLPFGTYYVCQDLQAEWIQTELAALGDGLGSIPAGTVLGDSQEIHDWVDEFCYEVVIDAASPISTDSVFGNYQPPKTPGNVLGDSTERPDPSKEKGEVLAASTGQVLAATGQPSLLPMIFGVMLLLGSLLTIRLARAK